MCGCTSAALQWVATSDAVAGWVADARGASREELQWQKFEDTSTGYWLTYAPMRVRYVNIGYWLHNHACARDELTRRASLTGALTRPPANFSLVVHNLKGGGFGWVDTVLRSADGAPPYDHAACVKATSELQGKARLERDA